MTPEQINNISQLGQKLFGLGIKASFSRLDEGPIVTAYYFKPDLSQNITKVMKQSENFAVALGVDKVSVQRIKDEIVLFVPNAERKIVDFKDALYWYCNDLKVKNMALPILLGMNFHGQKEAIDLATMPHILVAGETGSGKSVFEAAILGSLAVLKEPTDLSFYLVDTKQLDLPLFSVLPHVKEVIDNLDKFHDTIKYIVKVIRDRMTELKCAQVRNISEYRGMGLHMGYIVILIDELADLIDQDTLARKAGQYEDIPSVKQWLKHIVQISRAAGVHIIACTQRTSVKIVDGDTKANFPCRIALRLPTEADSRTILGTGGAQFLLGKGDMLIQRPEIERVERFHGPFVSMNDIAQIVTERERMREILVRSY